MLLQKKSLTCNREDLHQLRRGERGEHKCPIEMLRDLPCINRLRVHISVTNIYLNVFILNRNSFSKTKVKFCEGGQNIKWEAKVNKGEMDVKYI